MLRPEEIEPETPRALTRAEYDRMVDVGLFDDDKVELLEGVVITMSPQGPEHAEAVDRLNLLLIERIGRRARIRVQSSFAASESSEPEPDVAVVPPGTYRTEHPREAWLAIEVSKSTKKKDIGIKARVYASANVEEYWVVDVVTGTVAVHTGPGTEGYTDRKTYQRGERVRLVHFPDVEIGVDEIFAD